MPRGTDSYIIDHVKAKSDDMARLLRHISLINSHQVRALLIRRFLNVNKCLYLLKHCRVHTVWLVGIMRIYRECVHILMCGLPVRPIMLKQIAISSKRGGLTMRPPCDYWIPARLATLTSTTEGEVDRFHPFLNVAVEQDHEHEQVVGDAMAAKPASDDEDVDMDGDARADDDDEKMSIEAEMDSAGCTDAHRSRVVPCCVRTGNLAYRRIECARRALAVAQERINAEILDLQRRFGELIPRGIGFGVVGIKTTRRRLN